MYNEEVVEKNRLYKYEFMEYEKKDTVAGSMIKVVKRYAIVLELWGAISYINYKVVEIPFQKIGKWIIKKRKNIFLHISHYSEAFERNNSINYSCFNVPIFNLRIHSRPHLTDRSTLHWNYPIL